MREDMFRDVVGPSIEVGARKRYSVPAAIVVHALIIVAALVAPIVAPDVLPMPPEMLAFLSAAPAPTPAPPPPRASRLQDQPMANAFAPIEAPSNIAPEALPSAHDAEPVPLGVGVVQGVPESLGETSAPPPPPPSLNASPPQPVRPGAGIKPPMRITFVTPKYPAVAVAAHVEGYVVLEATIDTAGKVEALRILRSVPLLDQAAIDAVRQWQYAPTLLNDMPVPVLLTVTVRFDLR